SHPAEHVGQLVFLHRGQRLATVEHVGNEIAAPGNGIGVTVSAAATDNLGAPVHVGRHVGGRRRRCGGDLPGLLLDPGALFAWTVRDHRAVDVTLQFDDVVVVRRLDDDEMAAVLRDRDVAAAAHLGDLAPYPLGVARAAGLHGVDGDVALVREPHDVG